MLSHAMDEMLNDFARQATLAEQMVQKSIAALIEKDESLAHEVLERLEPQINEGEKLLEAKAAQIIALYAPKATDMRKVISVIKGNKDLERIGDQAVNIAGHALYLIPRKPVKPLIDIPRMGEIVALMIKNSLDAFLLGDVEKASKVISDDDLVDALNEQIIRELITFMISDPAVIERSMRLIFVTRNLERIGDLSLNIAEDVIYYMTGTDVRHPGKKGGTQ